MVIIKMILEKYGLAVLAVVMLVIWSIAHFSAAPGQSVTLFWGMVGYVKSTDGSGPPTGTEKETVNVYAAEEWQDSGIKLEAGKNFEITAEGNWNARTSTSIHGAEGIAKETRDYQMKGVNLGALLGKLGDSVFYVGTRYNGVASTSSVLQFGIQDKYIKDGKGGLSDNTGYLRVTVTF